MAHEQKTDPTCRDEHLRVRHSESESWTPSDSRYLPTYWLKRVPTTENMLRSRVAMDPETQIKALGKTATVSSESKADTKPSESRSTK